MKYWGGIFLSVMLLWAIVVINGLWPNIAQARPGGGHSSSGHHSSRSSSSRSYSWHRSSSRSYSGHSSSGASYSSQGGDIVYWLIFLLVVFAVIMVVAANQPPKIQTSRPNREIKNQQYALLSQALAQLQLGDPHFSKILLMDFVHLLYSKLYHYAGTNKFSYLTPFLSDELRQRVQFFNTQPALEVVINGIHWQTITQADGLDNIGLLIDANYTLPQHGNNLRYAVTERWLLSRQGGLLSPEPNKMQALSCPHCAAPAHFNDAGECPYCKTILHKGEAQWYLRQRAIVRTTQLDSSNSVSYAIEQGTDLATVKQDDLTGQMARMQQLHQFDSWDGFFSQFQAQVVKPYFLAIYHHWNTRDWAGVRHLLSDRLYEANQFWADRYQQYNWYNRLDKLNISRIVLARVELDCYYEAITVRIFASCYDYTEDAQGKVIGGSKQQSREFSEYWTFVRRSGVKDGKGALNLNQCPQCGAAADRMGQAAKCGYCGSKISTGEFSWVLFLIMQDDVYSG